MNRYDNLEDMSNKFVTKTATKKNPDNKTYKIEKGIRFVTSNNSKDNILINKPFNNLKLQLFKKELIVCLFTNICLNCF